MRLRSISLLALTAVVAGACAASFDIDLPGPPSLRILSLSSSGAIWPGRMGVPITVMIENAGVGTSGEYSLVTEVFDASGSRNDVVIEQVDALPFLQPGETAPVLFEAFVSTTAATTTFTLSVAITGTDDPPATLDFTFESIRQIVVDRTLDDVNGDGETTLREAILDAVATDGIERIVFDPAVFPPGVVTPVQLAPYSTDSEGLPIIDGSGSPILIDGDGRVRIEMHGTHKGSRVFGLRLIGPVTVSGLAFDGWEQSSPDIGAFDNLCFNDSLDTGGAVQILGGDDVSLHRLTITDRLQDYARSCWHAAVRVDGGEGHRIRDSLFEQFNGDAVRVRGGLREIARTVFRNASIPPEGTQQEAREPDSAVVIESLGSADFRFVGNVVAEMDKTTGMTNSTAFVPAISGVALEVLGSDGAGVLVAHNVFVRNEGGAVVRRGGRPMTFANNLYLGNDGWDLQDGADSAMFAETKGESDLFCNPSCPQAAQDIETFLTIANADFPLLVVSSSGESFESWTPVAGSALIDSGVDVADRNGTASGRFTGGAPERGPIEIP